MYQCVLAFLITALSVDSLSLYGSDNSRTFVINVADQYETGTYLEPPPHSEVAKMARYIVHISDWCVMSYKSQNPLTSGSPMGTILSVSDGPVGSGKGTPYVFVSLLAESVQDTLIDPRCSLTMTLAQGDYCKGKSLDPQYPTCAQVMLIGQIERVKNGTEEEMFARDALFSRHPSMKTWPKKHHFFFMKLNIEHIKVVDYFGGPIVVDLDDYYNVNQ